MWSDSAREQALTKEQRKQPSEAVVRMLQVRRRSLGSATQQPGYGESLKESQQKQEVVEESSGARIKTTYLFCKDSGFRSSIKTRMRSEVDRGDRKMKKRGAEHPAHASDF
ncbi:hypothetical protein SAMN04489868_11440 [Pisciglobus halotolerans]|uniref:Uncharacterized protein n=1 Tax=Pisciglobus halotolerans TaxID=745365 RepID=A0A1I3C7L8_9LACT|nr:hypothetical protein SAMN04489868_11440 [Pisciglobus halotolerans]